MSYVDPRPEYWAEYSNLQAVKHDLIRSYLQGWFPKLGFWAGRIVYFDTHAGRGKHLAGQLGSPLVALDTLLNHAARDKILEGSEVNFFLIERDDRNLKQLEHEIALRGMLPSKITCRPMNADAFQVIKELVEAFKASGKMLAPAFFFIDPYGFKVPGSILRELMAFERVELFVNVIWRELDMAIQQPDRMSDTLGQIFDGDSWKTAITSSDHVERSHQAANLIQSMTGAKWATHVRMLGENDATRYLLLHLTNHDAGRDLMKDCIWKVCPNAGFYARKSDNPNQEYLIEPQPDLSSLRSWLLERLSKGPIRWKVLLGDVRPTVWREPHLNRVIRALRKQGSMPFLVDFQSGSG